MQNSLSSLSIAILATYTSATFANLNPSTPPQYDDSKYEWNFTCSDNSNCKTIDSLTEVNNSTNYVKEGSADKVSFITKEAYLDTVSENRLKITNFDPNNINHAFAGLSFSSVTNIWDDTSNRADNNILSMELISIKSF